MPACLNDNVLFSSPVAHHWAFESLWANCTMTVNSDYKDPVSWDFWTIFPRSGSMQGPLEYFPDVLLMLSLILPAPGVKSSGRSVDKHLYLKCKLWLLFQPIQLYLDLSIVLSPRSVLQIVFSFILNSFSVFALFLQMPSMRNNWHLGKITLRLWCPLWRM